MDRPTGFFMPRSWCEVGTASGWKPLPSIWTVVPKRSVADSIVLRPKGSRDWETGRRPGAPASPGLVANRAPDQGGAGLQSRAGENLGVWSVACARWQGTDAMCRLAQLDELYRLADHH